MFLIAFCSCLPAWVIADLPFSRFLLALGLVSITLLAWERIALLFGIDPNLLLGILNYQNMWFTGFIFSGWFLPADQIIWPFRIYHYVLPTTYAVRSFIWAVYIDTPEYLGALECHIDNSSCTKGYFCPNASEVSCFGVFGADILDSVGANYFTAFSSDDTTVGDSGAIMAIAAVVWLFSCVQLVQLAALGKLPSPPTLSQNEKPVLVQGPVDDFLLSTLAQPSAFPDEATIGMKFDFSRCSFVVKSKKTSKTLLDNVSASVNGGEVLAIMGPSGAGKTTLLNLLTLTKGTGVASAVLTLGGSPFTARMYTAYCTFVEQTDHLWAFFTCEQHLSYASALCQPGKPLHEHVAVVNRLLSELGLDSCRDVRAGNALMKGLSGGQMRRLSVAVSLVKGPSVIFLDEPTSGLDAASAAVVMKLLSKVASSKSAAVLCTIHQPSASVFAGFDKTLILSAGRVAYFGAASQVEDYLSRIGHKVPPLTNPADYMLDLVNRDFSSSDIVSALLDAWNQESTLPATNLKSQERILEAEAVIPGWRRTFGQLPILIRKHMLAALQDPFKYSARGIMLLMMAIFMCVVFIESRKRVQEQVQRRAQLCWVMSNMPPSLAILPLAVHYFELKIVRRDIRDGLYHPILFATAHTAMDVLFVFILSLLTVAPTYLIGDWDWHSFWEMNNVNYITFYAFEMLALFYAMEDHPVVGLIQFINMWFTAMLMNGYMIPAKDIIWPLRTFTYALPLRWNNKAAFVLLFGETSYYSGAIECLSSNMSCPRGFYCPGESSWCYGYSGSQIMDSLQASFEVFDKYTSVSRYSLYIMIFCVVFKLCYCLRLSFAIRRQVPQQP